MNKAYIIQRQINNVKTYLSPKEIRWLSIPNINGIGTFYEQKATELVNKFSEKYPKYKFAAIEINNLLN